MDLKISNEKRFNYKQDQVVYKLPTLSKCFSLLAVFTTYYISFCKCLAVSNMPLRYCMIDNYKLLIIIQSFVLNSNESIKVTHIQKSDCQIISN